MSCLVPISLNLIVPRSRTQVLHIKDIKQGLQVEDATDSSPATRACCFVTLQFSPEACLSLC